MDFVDAITDFFRGKRFARYNLEYHFSTSNWNKTAELIKQNNGLQGMNELAARLDAARAEYREKTHQTIDGEREKENKLYTGLCRTSHRKNVFKWICIASFVLYIVTSVISGQNYSPLSRAMDWIGLLLLFVFAVTLVVAVILKIAEKISERRYKSYTEKVQAQFDSINGPYNGKVKQIYTEVDNLYLASLEPMQRELVLMRREQERQHQEAMKKQAELERKLADEQRRTREEQQRTRQVQEELLAIEKEREKRYWNSKY